MRKPGYKIADKEVKFYGKVTVVRLLVVDAYQGVYSVKGVAKCDTEDTFSEEIGEKVATNKAIVKYAKSRLKLINKEITDLEKQKLVNLNNYKDFFKDVIRYNEINEDTLRKYQNK